MVESFSESLPSCSAIKIGSECGQHGVRQKLQNRNSYYPGSPEFSPILALLTLSVHAREGYSSQSVCQHLISKTTAFSRLKRASM